jgi:hypothetical protein
MVFISYLLQMVMLLRIIVLLKNNKKPIKFDRLFILDISISFNFFW